MRKQSSPTEEREEGVCVCVYRCMYRLKENMVKMSKGRLGEECDVVLNGGSNGVSVL